MLLGTDDPLHTSQSVGIRSLDFATASALGSLGAALDLTDYSREDEDEGTE